MSFWQVRGLFLKLAVQSESICGLFLLIRCLTVQQSGPESWATPQLKAPSLWDIIACIIPRKSAAFFASLCKKWIMDHNTAHLRLFLHWFCLVNYKLDLKISAFCHCWKSRLQCKAVWIASRWQPSLMHLDMKSLLKERKEREKERKKTGKKPTKKSHTMFIVFYSFCIVLICFSFAAYL